MGLNKTLKTHENAYGERPYWLANHITHVPPRMPVRGSVSIEASTKTEEVTHGERETDGDSEQLRQVRASSTSGYCMGMGTEQTLGTRGNHRRRGSLERRRVVGLCCF